MYSVVIDSNSTPHPIIVAGDGGVFESVNRGQTWHKLGGGLPNVRMMMLALDSSAKPPLLRVASWGRGAFELALLPPACDAISKKVAVLSSNLRNLQEGFANGELPTAPITPKKIAALQAFIKSQEIELAKQQQVLQQCKASN